MNNRKERLGQWKRIIELEGPPLHEGATVIFNIEKFRLDLEAPKGDTTNNPRSKEGLFHTAVYSMWIPYHGLLPIFEWNASVLISSVIIVGPCRDALLRRLSTTNGERRDDAMLARGGN